MKLSVTLSVRSSVTLTAILIIIINLIPVTAFARGPYKPPCTICFQFDGEERKECLSNCRSFDENQDPQVMAVLYTIGSLWLIGLISTIILTNFFTIENTRMWRRLRRLIRLRRWRKNRKEHEAIVTIFD